MGVLTVTASHSCGDGDISIASRDPIGGGSVVTVTGTEFLSTLQCKFARPLCHNAHCCVIVGSAVQLCAARCGPSGARSDQQRTGLHRLERLLLLRYPSCLSSLFVGLIFPSETSALTSFVPTLGAMAGGTVVTVTGTAFVNSNQLVCKFGTLPLASGEFVSSTRVLCTSTASPATGAVSLSLSSNNQDFTSGATFTYLGISLVCCLSSDEIWFVVQVTMLDALEHREWSCRYVYYLCISCFSRNALKAGQSCDSDW